MDFVTLSRLLEVGGATPGLLYVSGELAAFTLERPWANNEHEVSCIPAGDYVIRWASSPHFGNCYRVENVRGRSDILIHPGNKVEDTKGCILVGRYLGLPDGGPVLSESRIALKALRAKLGTTFGLRIG